MSDYDDRVIAEFRANGGVVTGYGDGLVLLHTVGARSGERHLNPVLALLEGSSWLVIASAAGAPKSPGWYHNLVAHPDATIETGSGSLDVHAVDLGGAEWDAAFVRFLARSATFAEYRDRAAPRRMPILRLEPRG